MNNRNSQVRVKHHQWTRETRVMIIELDDGRIQRYDNITEVQYIDLVVNMPPSLFLPRKTLVTWEEKFQLTESQPQQPQIEVVEKGLMIDV